MTKPSWKSQTLKLYNLVKTLSNHYGGDDEEFLKAYARMIVQDYKENLECAIQYFENILKGLHIKKPEVIREFELTRMQKLFKE